MNRPDIDIVIPVQRESAQLERTLDLLHRHTRGFRLHVVKEPDLNVSEARQKAMDEVVRGDLICFIDDDSEMVMDGWLDELHRVLEANSDAGAVFGSELWGTEARPIGDPRAMPIDAIEVEYGPAACMLLDRRRLPSSLSWDERIGLRSGWLGGDFEEVDYCMRLSKLHGLRLLRATRAIFRHTGGKTTMREFMHTDRFKTVTAMKLLLDYKYVKAPEDGDWFKGLQYVQASGQNDCMLAPGATLRECYRDVIRRNGLGYVRNFRQWGLVLKEERRHLWDRLAFDAVGDLASEDRPEYRVRREKMLVDLLSHPFKGKTVLEVGCGPGGNLAAIEALKPKALAGCDVSPEMVARAKARTRAEIVLSEEIVLPFLDRQFDVVFTVTVLQHVPESVEALIVEIARVAKHTILIYEDMAGVPELSEPRYPWVPRPQVWYAEAFAKVRFDLVATVRTDALVGHPNTDGRGLFRMEFVRARRDRS